MSDEHTCTILAMVEVLKNVEYRNWTWHVYKILKNEIMIMMLHYMKTLGGFHKQ